LDSSWILVLGADEHPIFAELTNQRVVFFERDLGLDLARLKQGAHVAQAQCPLGQGSLAGTIDGGKGVTLSIPRLRTSVSAHRWQELPRLLARFCQ
jgi:hypothetical protein